jgi:hypothetical protein
VEKIARYYLYVLRALTALFFVGILFLFLQLFDFNEILITPEGNVVFIDVIIKVKELLSYALFFILYVICIAIAFIVIIISLFHIKWTLFDTINSFFKEFLDLWFSFPTGTAPELLEVPGLMLDQIFLLLGTLYLFVFQLLFIIVIYYIIRGIFQSRPKNNIRAVVCLILMFIFPLMVFGFREVLALFGLVQNLESLEKLIFLRYRDILALFGLVDPSTYPEIYYIWNSNSSALITLDTFLKSLEISALYEIANPSSPLLTQLPIDDFFAFLGSPVTLFAIFSYLFLEITFQINYIDLVTQPSLERSERLETQLYLLQKESLSVTANIDKIKKEAKMKREELALEKEPVSKFLRKKEEKFSYVKEMIQKKKLEEEEKKLVRAASKTRRLGRYIDRLFKEDVEAESTLTASSSVPQSKNIAKSTIINSVIRVLILVIISYIIIHAKLILQGLPPSISESIAMSSPEIVLLLLIPLLLIFPIIAKVISYIKHKNLVMKLQQEEKVQEILARVGDYLKKEEGPEGAEDFGEQEDIGIEEEATTEQP